MAWEIPGKMFSLPAAADLSAKQYRFLTGNQTDGVNVAATGVDVVGVQQNVPFGVIGEAITIMADGISKVVCDGNVAKGVAVKVGGSGGAVTATSGTKGVGIALEDGVVNQIISVELKDLGTAA